MSSNDLPPGVALVDVGQLMHELVIHMPAFVTRAEEDAYLAAVKDIAIQANTAVRDCDRATGELTHGPALDLQPTAIVDEALRERWSERSTR